ncbi:hypothetical protein B0T24DRAFT_74474 [Lasiosphaeria ovina]|uniref:Uncharacterized protein n=1 Tax=Lasiosphaeria ovina TaxID=92902 RepID=A0AAE0TYH0_9PEZI|nr:hypothetical protein B0T24DRAFT_74474 [Lasiosphaeria ovina]
MASPTASPFPLRTKNPPVSHKRPTPEAMCLFVSPPRPRMRASAWLAAWARMNPEGCETRSPMLLVTINLQTLVQPRWPKSGHFWSVCVLIMSAARAESRESHASGVALPFSFLFLFSCHHPFNTPRLLDAAVIRGISYYHIIMAVNACQSPVCAIPP